MPRRYFDMSDAWSKLERQKRGDQEHSDQSPKLIAQVPGRNPYVHSHGIGLDSSEVRFGDDPAVKLGEHVDSRGNVVQQYQRLDQNGTSRGTYEVRWEWDGRGHRLTDTRRVHGG